MKLRQPIKTIEYVLVATLGLGVCFMTWFFVTKSGRIQAFFLPAPDAVAASLLRLFSQGELLSAVGASLSRIGLGFLVSIVLALPLGIALGVSKRAEALFEPIIAFVRYIPPSAFIPLMIIWFGIGESQKIAVIFVSVAPYLTLLVADAIAVTRHELVHAAQTLGAGATAIVCKVIVPHALPSIWDSLRIMFGSAWTFVIIAEIVGSASGLGHLIIESQRFLRTDTIFASLFTIGTLGLATDYAFKLSQKALFPWMEKVQN